MNAKTLSEKCKDATVIVPDESGPGPEATGWLVPEPVLFINCYLSFIILYLLRKK